MIDDKIKRKNACESLNFEEKSKKDQIRGCFVKGIFWETSSNYIHLDTDEISARDERNEVETFEEDRQEF